MIRAAVIVLAVYSAVTTLALAWLLGRSSVSQAPAAQIVAPRPPVQTPTDRPAIAPPPARQAHFPLYQATVPKAFRGRWDEIVSDKCEGREARFSITAETLSNFEVEWEVTKVKLYSPAEIDIFATAYDENKNQVDEVWQFRLDGERLTSRKPGGTYFKRCPGS